MIQSSRYNIHDGMHCMKSALKVSKYRVISGPYFPVFNPNIGKYGPEITPYLDTFHAVMFIGKSMSLLHDKFKGP